MGNEYPPQAGLCPIRCRSSVLWPSPLLLTVQDKWTLHQELPGQNCRPLWTRRWLSSGCASVNKRGRARRAARTSQDPVELNYTLWQSELVTARIYLSQFSCCPAQFTNYLQENLWIPCEASGCVLWCPVGWGTYVVDHFESFGSLPLMSLVIL